MSENLIPSESAPAFKLFPARDIMTVALFGGPFACAYMLSENFSRLGKKKQSKKIFIFGILLGVILLCVTIVKSLRGWMDVVPEPAIFIGLGDLILFGFFTYKYQGTDIKSFISHGGVFVSVWRSLTVALLAILAGIIVAYLIAFLDTVAISLLSIK